MLAAEVVCSMLAVHGAAGGRQTAGWCDVWVATLTIVQGCV